MKRYVFCDLDGTLLRGDTLMLFLLDCVRRGWLSPLRLGIVVGAFAMSKLGRIGRDRLRQITYDQIFAGRAVPRDAIDRFIGGLLKREERWNREVLAILRAEAESGATLVMVTNSFDFLAAPIARHFGFHEVHAVRAPIAGETFDACAMEALIGERKAQIVRAMADEDSILTGLGNTSDDLDFLKLCRHAYMVTKSARYRTTAEQQGWRIIAP